MSEYWKSTAKKYCTICKMWYADNKVSVENHELGVKHKAMVQQRLRESTRKAQEKDRKDAELQHILIQMEQAALASLTQDDKKRIAQEPSTVKPPRLPSKIELQRQEFREQKRKLKELKKTSRHSQFWGNDDQEAYDASGALILEKEWVQAYLETGEPYYWHVTTGETSWDQPSSFYTTDEYSLKYNEIFSQAGTSAFNYNYSLYATNTEEIIEKIEKKEVAKDKRAKKHKEINSFKVIEEPIKKKTRRKIEVNLNDLSRPTEIKIESDQSLNEMSLESDKKLELNNEIKNESVSYLNHNTEKKIEEAAAPLLGPWIPVIPKKKEAIIISDLPPEASIVKTQSEIIEEMQLGESELQFNQKVLPESKKKSLKTIEFKKRSFTNKGNLRSKDS